jgi:hypothetical protein
MAARSAQADGTNGARIEPACIRAGAMSALFPPSREAIGFPSRKEQRGMLKSVLGTSMIALALFAAAALAEVHPTLDAQAIVAQQKALRGELDPRKGRYKDLSADSRAKLIGHQREVLQRLEGKTATTELREHDQVAVFDALEAIEAIISKAEDDRMVCEQTRSTGSKRVQSVCMTVAERRARRTGAQ